MLDQYDEDCVGVCVARTVVDDDDKAVQRGKRAVARRLRTPGSCTGCKD